MPEYAAVNSWLGRPQTKPSEGAGRRVGSFHLLSLLVAVLLLVATAAVTVFAQELVASQERSLLTERTNEVNLVLSNTITTISTDLDILSQSYTNGGPSGFVTSAQAVLSTGSRTRGFGVLRPNGNGFVVVAAAGQGLTPGQLVRGSPLPAIEAAQRGSKMAATNVYLIRGTRAIGFALRARDGALIFEQSLLGPVSPPSEAGTRPFSELRAAVYASAKPEPGQVVVATTRSLPLTGAVRYAPLMVGSTTWVTAVNAVHPLVGSVAAAAPWVALAVGVIGSALVFLLVESIARRRDVAVEALEMEHRFAESLQRRLLPAVPTLPGLDVASSYVAGADHQQVGGDWFDVFELPSGQVAVVIGDVMGHDVEAAAIMAQLRSSLRSYASDGRDPAWTLERLVGYLDLFEVPAVVTVVYGILDPPGADGCRRFRWANAGHLPPLLRHADGRVEELSDGASPLLGAPSFAPRPVGEKMLPARSTLLLYTDGLVEVRHQSLGVTIGELREVFGRADRPTAQEVCDSILATQLPGSRRDDVALLVVRLDSDPSELHHEHSGAGRAAQRSDQ